MKMNLWKLLLAVVAVVFLSAVPANAQAIVGTNANGPQAIALTYTVNPTLTVTVNQSSLSWADGNAAPAFSITTSWNVNSSWHTIVGDLYFQTADALSDGNGDNILNTQIQASVNGGTATPFTTANYGGQFTIPYRTVSLNGDYNGSVTDSVVLSVVNPGQVAPATYSGTLYVFAYGQ